MTSESIFDHTQDLTGTEKHRLTQICPAPEFVKSASHDQLCGNPETLEAHLYANATDRVYPCHTKAATWMSALFFGDKCDQLSQTKAAQAKQRIWKAAGYWGIQPMVQDAWDKVAAAKQAGVHNLTDDDFALVWEQGGKKERHYPLRNAAEVKQASNWFNEHHAQFNFDDKHMMATRILEKAAAYNAAVENAELLQRCAGRGYCPKADAVAAWTKRSELVANTKPDYAMQARKMADSINASNMEIHEQGRRIKLASVMSQYDHVTGLRRLYSEDGGLERPEDVLFKVTEKVAREFVSDHVQTINGAIYEKAALSNLDIEQIQKWMGDDIADACGGVLLDTEKLAELLPTLPRPDADMFERMAEAANVPVSFKEKSASAAGFHAEHADALKDWADKTYCPNDSGQYDL